MFLLSFYDSDKQQRSINQNGFTQAELTQLRDPSDRPGPWRRTATRSTCSAPMPTEGSPLPPGNACVSCHIDHGAFDGTFAQFYPTIRPLIPKEAAREGRAGPRHSLSEGYHRAAHERAFASARSPAAARRGRGRIRVHPVLSEVRGVQLALGLAPNGGIRLDRRAGGRLLRHLHMACSSRTSGRPSPFRWPARPPTSRWWVRDRCSERASGIVGWPRRVESALIVAAVICGVFLGACVGRSGRSSFHDQLMAAHGSQASSPAMQPATDVHMLRGARAGREPRPADPVHLPAADSRCTAYFSEKRRWAEHWRRVELEKMSLQKSEADLQAHGAAGAGRAALPVQHAGLGAIAGGIRSATRRADHRCAGPASARHAAEDCAPKPACRSPRSANSSTSAPAISSS